MQRNKNANKPQQDFQPVEKYEAKKKDKVDRFLSDYINCYPFKRLDAEKKKEFQPLKVPFVREDEGIYKFGSKKVAAMICYDREGFPQLKFRIGGGFLSIDEFIDIYTPQEIEKKERKNNLKMKLTTTDLSGGYKHLNPDVSITDQELNKAQFQY